MTSGVRRLVALRVALGLLLVPSAAVTLLRLLQPEHGPAIRVVSFTPYALLSYALAAVLAVLLLVVGRRTAGDLAVTAVVVVGLAFHTAWVWPLFTGSAPDPTGDERVVVMTVNASFGDGDAATVVDEVRESEVDVLSVSEIDGRFLEGLEAAGLDDLMPERAGDPGYNVEGTMVFSREPIRVLQRLPTTFEGLVVDTAGLTVVAVHPKPPTFPDDWVSDHALVRDAAREHDADVVTGDLNATLDHAPLRRLVGDGFRDAVELTNGGFSPTWPSHGEYPPFPGPVVAIDHVLVRAPWTVTAVHDVDVPDTDHRGVVATLAPAG